MLLITVRLATAIQKDSSKPLQFEMETSTAQVLDEIVPCSLKGSKTTTCISENDNDIEEEDPNNPKANLEEKYPISPS